VQSIYGIRDPLTTGVPTTPIHANLRASLARIALTNTTIDGDQVRTGDCAVAGGCPRPDGWFADWPDTRERVNVDIKLQLGTLTVESNVPENTACSIGGYSYINFFDYTSGLPISTSPDGIVGYRLADSLAVGLNIVRLPSGKTVAISTTSDSQQRTSDVPIASPSITGRRVSWREIGE
jgi:type IV pilus assembly protein PilY1